MSYAQQLAKTAQIINTTEYTSKINDTRTFENVCYELYCNTIIEINKFNCVWDSEFKSVIVDINEISHNKFWIFTNEYGIVLRIDAYLALSDLFSSFGFKLISCEFNPPDTKIGKPIRIHLEIKE